jgi:hypothetical protein
MGQFVHRLGTVVISMEHEEKVQKGQLLLGKMANSKEYDL